MVEWLRLLHVEGDKMWLNNLKTHVNYTLKTFLY